MAAVQSTEVKSAKETFPLNYDCAYALFDWVDLDECMNLAEAFADLKPMAHRMYKRKFNTLSFDFGQPINRILHNAGPTAKSLTLTLNKFDYAESDLIKIGNTCKKLRSLTINGFDRQNVAVNPFDNFTLSELEVLTLNQCTISDDDCFFDACKSLKCLNVSKCNIPAIKKCFVNNSGIYSFTCNSNYLQFPNSVAKHLPSLERLSLRYNSQFMNLDMLSTLPFLRRLTLFCDDCNVNDVLAELVKSNCLQELVLDGVDIDGNTFPLIGSLQNLTLLTVSSWSWSCPFPASTQLPKKLKTLKLGGFCVAKDDIASTVRRLVHLEAINLEDCELWWNGDWVSDFGLMADLIKEDLLGKHKHRQLHVAIADSESDHDQTPKIKETIQGITITNYVDNQSSFEISYPGMVLPEN